MAGLILRNATKAELIADPPVSREIVYATDTGELGTVNASGDLIWQNPKASGKDTDDVMDVKVWRLTGYDALGIDAFHIIPFKIIDGTYDIDLDERPLAIYQMEIILIAFGTGVGDGIEYSIGHSNGSYHGISCIEKDNYWRPGTYWNWGGPQSQYPEMDGYSMFPGAMSAYDIRIKMKYHIIEPTICAVNDKENVLNVTLNPAV